MKRKVILDVDTGLDDAIALLLAGHHPALELVAVTVTHGNAPLAVTLDNTLRLLAAGGLAHVPVYAGAERALVGAPPKLWEIQTAVLPLPPTSLAPRAGHAVDFLLDYYTGPDGAAGPEGAATTYVPLGPQTNLALALRLQPALAGRLPRLVTMAGAFQQGNTTPSAEFNILADPEAAYIVFNAGVPITMIGLEVTAQALVTAADLARLRSRPSPVAEISAALIDPQIHWYIDNLGWEGGPIFDACAVAAVVDSSLVKTQAARVEVELSGEHTRGRTVADLRGYDSLPPNVDVGVGIDRERFIAIMFEALLGPESADGG